MQQDTPLEVRNLKFGIGPRVPRFWNGGRRSVTSFFDNLSVFFPVGERFFITSVRAHLRHVKDPVLLREVRAFCGQEGAHGREHVRYNEMLRDAGYPVVEMEKKVERLLALVTRTTRPRWRLAATCALEHFTALLAHFLLTDPRLLADADPTMAALWRWHAAEENEHKAVAFDVYQAAGGHYTERCAIMLAASVIFWAKVGEQQVRMMAADGTALSATEWARLARFLFVEPGGFQNLVPLYLDYFRPGFHPWDLDNRELLDAWKRELGASEVYRDAAA
jgi:uncharacterized protein